MFPATSIEWLSKLVSFDTTSVESNLELIDYIAQYLKKLSIPYDIQLNKSKTKANILAKLIPSVTGSEKGGILLSGHLDCVPVTGQKWETNSFVATRVEDRIYGRGTCDMKGFIAVCFALLPSIIEAPLKKAVYLSLTYDEEVGCIGGEQLAKSLKKQQIKIDGCIVGEPTSNKVVLAHKGICVWKVCIRGKACHSSFALTRKGCNAIEYAAQLVVAIRAIAEELKQHGDHDEYYDTPYSTVTANIINGGNAINTIPEYCEVVYEFRNLPTIAQETIQNKIATYIDNILRPALLLEFQGGLIELQCLARVPSCPDIDESQPFVKLMRKITKDNDCHKLGCTTEAGHFALIGIPVVICGPGSIEVAHQPNEFVPVKDLYECEKNLRELLLSNNDESMSKLESS